MAQSIKIPNKAYPTPLEILEVDKTGEKDYNEYVQFCSLIDAKVKIVGTTTKTEYVFAKAGTVVAVNKLDADEILNKKKGRACCGGNSGAPLFQLA
jgi:hypothetical protein